MTIIAAVLALALVAVVYLMLRHAAEAERAWTAERRELLSRIQRPELLPSPTGEPFAFPDTEPDQLELIGTIQEPPEE